MNVGALATERVLTRTDLPVFRGPDCRARGRVHDPNCTAALSEDGCRRKARCRCVNATTTIDRGACGAVLLRRGNAALVRFDGFAPVWVESSGLKAVRRHRPDEIVVQGSAPADYLAVRRAIQLGLGSYPRRNRAPAGGEIVFLRSDKNAGIYEPMRYLCTATFPTRIDAICIHPSLPADVALHPPWHQLYPIELHDDGRPERLLFPAFPLPDGTDNPGWGA